jgi:hypothetical protein
LYIAFAPNSKYGTLEPATDVEEILKRCVVKMSERFRVTHRVGRRDAAIGVYPILQPDHKPPT